MTAEEMWTISGLGGSYSAWQFGDDPDRLAALVKAGKKTATSSLNYWYQAEPEEFPQKGEISVILDSRDEAVCIIQTTDVKVIPFREISAEDAFKEGEGDRSLEYWRNVHRAFFTKELQEEGVPFEESMEVVYETFEVIFP